MVHKGIEMTGTRLIENRFFKSLQFSSFAQSCLTLCNPMNHSTPGLSVHHQLLEFTQTHVHRVGMPPSHLILCCPLFLLPPIPPSIRVFSKESTLRMSWPNYWGFSFSISPSNEHPGLISFRMDWLDLLSVFSPRDSPESSPTPQFKSINSLALRFLHSPTVTSIHDHWKSHSQSTIFPASLATNPLEYLVLPEPLHPKQLHHLHTWPSQGQTQVLQGKLRSKSQWMTHMQRSK